MIARSRFPPISTQPAPKQITDMSSDTDSIVESVDSVCTNSQSSVINAATKPTKDSYKFFRSFSVKVDSWPMRKAEQLWRKLRDHRLAGLPCLWMHVPLRIHPRESPTAKFEMSPVRRGTIPYQTCPNVILS